MKDKIKQGLKKAVVFLSPWIVLVAILSGAVYFGSQWLADWHYNEFVAPFLK